MKKDHNFKGNRSAITAKLVREVTNKSGKTQSDLEEIFDLDRKSDGSGRYWRKLKSGDATLRSPDVWRIAEQAHEKGFLEERKAFGLILDSLALDNDKIRIKKERTADKKIELYLSKITDILFSEMKDMKIPVDGVIERHIDKLGAQMLEMALEKRREIQLKEMKLLNDLLDKEDNETSRENSL
ncbi:hypothetical protein ACUUL3_16775 [Thiovibrio sp. JS02]